MSDKELEDYLSGKTGLPDAYGNLPELPAPDHLDAAILAEAHRAVNAGSRDARARKPRWMAWTVPIYAMATLFVVVMIGMEIPYITHDMPAESTATSDSGSQYVTVKPQAAAPSKRLQADKQPETNDGYTYYSLKQERARAGKMTNAMKKENAGADEARARAMHQQLAAPAQKPAAPMPAETMTQSDIGAKSLQENRALEMSDSKPVLKAAPEPAPVPAQAPAETAVAAPPAAEAAAPSAAAEAPAPTEALVGAAGFAAPDPRQWLARIIELKRQGKLAEAKKQLAEFRKRYPGYTVPKAAEVK